MSKAIQGVAELAGAAALGAGAFLTGGAALAIPGYAQAMTSLVISGIASEAGAIADALTSNRSMQISKRQPASNRGIIYGTQMTGGTVVHMSTTGHQYNRVIVLAGHVCHSIQGVWIDGRKVYFTGSGSGWNVRNGVGFGGNADGNDHLGPDGITHYNFGGKVYIEARYGDQLPGDYMTSLQAQAGSNWGPSGSDSPDLMGCTYIYVKITASSTQFPQEPEIRVLVNGKSDILDPRTGTRGFTNNAALVMADVITDTQFGMGDNNVDQAQLIAAANICDEQVAVAALNGGTESRYGCDYAYDTGTPPADVLQTMLTGMAGRLSNVGGSWFIYPGAYVGPSIALDKSIITAPLSWNPRRSVRDLPNRVTGTHIAPEWPFSVTGNWYQRSGSGTPNTFDLKFTSSNYPYYAVDTLHGYPSDQYLSEDNGHVRPLELPLPTVLSVTQCQRIAKINLMRSRKLQGSGTIEVGMGAYKLIPCDTFRFTFSELGWSNKLIEVTGTGLRCEKDDNGVPTIRYTLNVQETDPSIYAWSTIEELTVYSSPAGNQYTYVPTAPTNLQLESDATTAIVNPDGSVAPSIKVSWDTPLDLQAYGVSIQYKPHAASNWWSWPDVTIDQNSALVTAGIVAGQAYDVRIRTVRTTGAYSDWLGQDNFPVPVLDSFLGQLGATLPNTQGWIGKWWRLPSGGSPPSGGELTVRPMYTTQSSQINYSLYVPGAIDYRGYGGIQAVPPAPDGGDNSFIYARFTGTFICTATGTYTFGVNGDDGSTLTVNNVRLFSSLGAGSSSSADRTYTQAGTVNLTAGQKYPIVLEYWNGPGSGCIQLLYQGPGDTTPQLCDLSFAFRDANQLTYRDGTSVQSTQVLSYSGVSESLVPNGSFAIGTQGWVQDEGSANWLTEVDAEGTRIHLVGGSTDSEALSPAFSVIPGKSYKITYRIYISSGSQNIYLRINYGNSYAPNIRSSNRSGITDFIGGGSGLPINSWIDFSYDWTCPGGVFFASLAVYKWGGGTADVYLHRVSCVPYGGVGQWGADVTGLNTSNNTNNVGSRSAGDVSNTILPGGGIDYLHIGNLNFPQNSTNLLRRGSFEDGKPGQWGGSVVPVSGQIFHNALAVNGRDSYESGNVFPVVPGQRIYIAAYADTSNSVYTSRIGLQFMRADGSIVNWAGAFGIAPHTGWQLYSGFVVVPDGVATATPWLQIDGPAGGIPPSYLQVANLFYTTSAPVDFNNPYNSGQGDLSKINQANTQNIVAGAVNSSVLYQSTSLQFISGSEQVIGQAAINTNGGYVKVIVALYISTSNATFLPTVTLRQGGVSGTILARAPNVNVTVAGYSAVSFAVVDASASPFQQYTVTLDPGPNATITCQYISLVIENSKV